jgi:hypothetical protein
MSCEISISLASLRKTNVVVWSLLVSFDCVGGERLLQFRVLGFGLLQDWDVRVGVFPEREEIFVRDERPDAGGTVPVGSNIVEQR